MPGIPQSRGLDRMEDFWGGAGGGSCGSLSRSLRQEREVLRREKGARLPLEKWKSIGRLDQAEDETVGGGRGRGTNACTQSNDERSRAVSCL